MTRAELKAEREAVSRLQMVAADLTTIQDDYPLNGLCRDILLVTRNLEAVRKAGRAEARRRAGLIVKKGDLQC